MLRSQKTQPKCATKYHPVLHSVHYTSLDTLFPIFVIMKVVIFVNFGFAGKWNKWKEKLIFHVWCEEENEGNENK